jgi:hypothetical protein
VCARARVCVCVCARVCVCVCVCGCVCVFVSFLLIPVLLPGHHVAPQLAQAKAQHQSSMNAALQKQADEMKRAAAVDG